MGGRTAILAVHAKRVPLAQCVDLDAVAAMTPGFTGADLANLVNEAALRAARRGADALTMEYFTQAIERIVAGLEKKSRLLNPREREVVAYHEMGHALVAAALPGVDPVHKVSIIPRGVGALGRFGEREFSEETAREIDCAVRELVEAAADQALAVLGRYAAQLDDGARRLLEKETLMRDELPKLDSPAAPMSDALDRRSGGELAPGGPTVSTN